MDALSITTIIILVGLAVWLIATPLWRQTHPQNITQDDDTSARILEEYQANYQAALAAIKELNFDHEMGKVSTEDYESLLVKAKLEAAQIRKKIDQLSESLPDDAAPDRELDARLEAWVAQLRSTSKTEDEPLRQEVEAEIERLKTVDAETALAICPHCQKSVRRDDKFCSVCGQPLNIEEPALDSETPPPEANVCSQCGYRHEPDDAYCARCGELLDETVVKTYEGVS